VYIVSVLIWACFQRTSGLFYTQRSGGGAPSGSKHFIARVDLSKAVAPVMRGVIRVYKQDYDQKLLLYFLTA
jgi:hypothetical protein